MAQTRVPDIPCQQPIRHIFLHPQPQPDKGKRQAKLRAFKGYISNPQAKHKPASAPAVNICRHPEPWTNIPFFISYTMVKGLTSMLADLLSLL
jgi:hypothetical protein